MLENGATEESDHQLGKKSISVIFLLNGCWIREIDSQFSEGNSRNLNGWSPSPLFYIVTLFSRDYTIINSEVYPPDRALPPKNQTLHFSYQYLQTQSVEQDFVNKNSLFIKRGVKDINFIGPTIAEINKILSVKSKFSCKYFQISLLESRKMMIYLLYSYWLIHPYRASRHLLESWSRWYLAS
jgi:hypothetical protein